ncbi:MAG: GNAT family N-acetyltransferase [Chitinophagaceae bacterium]|nr:GNAT family N-acetyltransferase [Chitinophagaceae bacterium]
MLNPRFNPFPALTTERLLLREIKAEDKREIFFLRSDKRVLAFLGKEPARRMQEAAEFIRMIKQAAEKNQTVLWGITLKENPEVIIGTICLWNLQKENHRAEVGYVLHPDFWKKV